jgi:hypothetical protein
MLCPSIDHPVLQHLKIKNKLKQDIHLAHILRHNNLPKLHKRQLIHPKANNIRKDPKQHPIPLPIRRADIQLENNIIGGFQKLLIPLDTIEYLL